MAQLAAAVAMGVLAGTAQLNLQGQDQTANQQNTRLEAGQVPLPVQGEPAARVPPADQAVFSWPAHIRGDCPGFLANQTHDALRTNMRKKIQGDYS